MDNDNNEIELIGLYNQMISLSNFSHFIICQKTPRIWPVNKFLTYQVKRLAFLQSARSGSFGYMQLACGV